MQTVENQEKKKIFLVRISLIFFAFVVSLGFSEFLARFYFKPPPIYPLVFDQELGWAGRPNAAGWNHETKLLTKRSKTGFHDPDIGNGSSKECTLNLYGDSMVESIQFANRDIFPTLLQEKFRAFCKSPRVNNFGVSGYSPLQELILFKKMQDTYPSDVSILFIFMGNDFENIYSETQKSSNPAFGLIDGRLSKLSNSHIQNQLKSSVLEYVTKITDKSAIVGTVANSIQQYLMSRESTAILNQVHNNPFVEDMKLAAMSKTLRMFVTNARNSETALMIVIIPDPLSRENAGNISRRESLIGEFCKTNSLTCLNLRETWMKGSNPLNKEVASRYFINGTGHLTLEGHKNLGHLLWKILS